MQLKQWSAFVLLGLIWGSSFLWIKIAVQETGPFTLVFFRLLFGLAGLLTVAAIKRQTFPRDRRTLLAYGFMGLFNTALPFTLITWGEQFIDSSLASILNGTMPLFTIVIANFWLQDDKMTAARLVGLLAGFVGIVVLVSRDLQAASLTRNVLGQLAVLAAALSYATAVTFSRRYLRGQSPLVQATLTLLVADAIMLVAAPAFERPINLPGSAQAWFAIAWLGILGSCTAYLLFFYLINAWGPTRASVVTYVFPVIGLILGIVFLGERADFNLILGSLLIVAGIVAVNVRRAPKPAPAAQPAAAPGD